MTSAGSVDFALGGVVRIRIEAATDRDVAVVVRQIGPVQVPVEGDADIVLSFCDKIVTATPLALVAVGESGATDDAFYILSGKAKTPGKAAIAFDQIGSACRIECERSLPAVPHLLAIINMTMLAKGVLPLHASAYVRDGVGVLVMGWAKGGKTELLLSQMEAGADYVGDEWVYVDPSRELFGVPEPIRLWRWHLQQLPGLAAKASRSAHLRMSGASLAATTCSAAERVLGRSAAAGSVLRRAKGVLARQAYVQLSPRVLFPGHCLGSAKANVLVWARSSEDPQISVSSAEPAQLAHSMLASLDEERAPFLEAYRQFTYAFPDRRSPVVDNAPELERQLLEKIVEDVPILRLDHPYPVDIAQMGDILEAHIVSRGTAPSIVAADSAAETGLGERRTHD